MLEVLKAWAEPTAFGLLGLVFLAMVFGLIVPLRQLRRELAREKEISDYFRKAAEAQDARADRLVELLADAMQRERKP